MGGEMGEKDQERPWEISGLLSTSFCIGGYAAIGSCCSQISQGNRGKYWAVCFLKTALWPQVGLPE